MKIFLFSSPGIDITPEELSGIFSSLSEHSFEWAANEWFAKHVNKMCGIGIPADKIYSTVTPDMAGDSIMISYGGDGTFLDAVRSLGKVAIPVLGVNFGHLGFLANVPKSEIKNIFREIEQKNYSLSERTLLKIEGDFESPPEHPYALNDVVIHRDDVGMTAVNLSVKGEKLAVYRGDGVIISTPTGSTAYSLSAGGPIVSPACQCFIISPIAPHNLSMRPVVVPDNREIEFTVNSRDPHALLSLDNLSFRVRNGSTFRVSKGEKTIFLVKLQNISFYDTLRNKMMWGLDGRDQRD